MTSDRSGDAFDAAPVGREAGRYDNDPHTRHASFRPTKLPLTTLTPVVALRQGRSKEPTKRRPLSSTDDRELWAALRMRVTGCSFRASPVALDDGQLVSVKVV